MQGSSTTPAAAPTGDAAPEVLAGATVPVALVAGAALEPGRDGLARVDIGLADGRIAFIRPAGAAAPEPGWTVTDLDGGLVLPLFADIHTHLDKGQIWPRRPNPDGRFISALEAVSEDRIAHWTAEDVRRRMEFSLRSAYAHGTRVIRTHLDSIPPQQTISWPVFAELRAAWAGRIDLQAVALVGPDTMVDADTMDAIARTVKAHGGALGGAVADVPHAAEAIAVTVATAKRHGLDLDLHIDETENPASTALRLLADAVIEQRFIGRVLAGHCCSLARQDPDVQDRTMDRVAEAGIAIVSLPMCNLYLQDRHRLGGDDAAHGPRRTPRWRGVTLVHELRARGIQVAVASDNTRDPFYAYGDLDGMEVLREATRICHLDHAEASWIDVMSRMPADIVGAAPHGRLSVGGPADLIRVRARTYTELFARPQSDRIILRDGRRVDAALPDYRDLDDLFGAPS